MRSARGRVTAAGLATAAAVGLAAPAWAGPMTGHEEDGGLGGNPVPAAESHSAAVTTQALAEGCESAAEVPARLVPDTVDLSRCDLRGTLIRAGTLTVRVPRQAGRGATASSLVTADAPASTVTRLSVVNTGGEVRVDVVHAGDAPAQGAAMEPAVSDGCTKAGYAYLDTHNARMTWYFNADSVPAYLSDRLAEQAIAEGARRTATGANDCGLPPLTGIEQSYAGTTSDHVDCAGPDGRSTVGFGPRPTGTLATSCWWWNRTADGVREVYEVDTRFQDDPGTFYYSEPSRCSGRSYQLTGVAAHEFGHAFGLAHISEQRYPHQTMSTVAPTCSDAQASLGRGDWLGLRNLYG